VSVRVVAVLVAVLLVAVFPMLAGNYPVKLLQEILVWGVFAMSLDLLMGFAGMVSFGHSAFFGVGGYVAALALTRWGAGGVNGLVLPALAAAVAALVIGYCSIRVSGVYFIMLTLAFSQMFYAVTFQVDWLGAEDGIVGVPRPRLVGVELGPSAFHLSLVAVTLLATLALWRIVCSPFGHVLRGIHDNEGRMQAIGYPVDRYKLVAFVIAGTVAGVAGALYAQLAGSITPDAFLWTTSGEALLMAIIGGTGTLGGALLGAAAFILLQSLVSSYTERWMLLLGLTFIVFVLMLPGGIVGALRGRIGFRA
jgi:branched-chain amino acid transport system permease protein